MKILAWLFGTRAGQVLVLALLIAGLIFGLKSCGKKEGYEQAQVEQAVATGKANVKEHDRQVERDQTSAAITSDTNKKAEEAVATSEKNTTELKEKVRDVYGQKPKTAPVAVGVVLHPLDERVQDAINRAVDQANTAAR